ncbi:MAG: hypothetical protein KME15_20475 [Drouetiella hepatica Uher 2000/2452]|jgi:hypothetical protein|uniref:Uncharacterized protein n=1 Tax=Drouetiella hepatica Uher 2000/2452 TaxID=904376 RepID=A0A951UR22_9CYAN|nr:hypothetical protein [Drouetiella hepatica Uher 2000/2452]
MSAKFLEGLGGKLAEQWVATLLTPAFVFWAGGFAAGIQCYGWISFTAWFTNQPEPLQIALLVGGFCLIAASAFVIQRFDLVVLRFLEGYWHPWLRSPRRWLIKRQAARIRKMGDRFQTLASLEPTQRTAELIDEYVQLDWQLMHTPLRPDRLMPTRLGNVLRAAELRPLEKYGLDAVICWPRLWLLLPDGVKKDLQEARADLNTAARVWLWSLLFMGWSLIFWCPWSWWTALVGLASALFAYYAWMLEAAGTYADLLESTFDLYRPLLYQSLRWALPTNPLEERKLGEALTEYLWRGSDAAYPIFTQPNPTHPDPK